MMRYSLLAGGKRLRPVLVMAAAELCGGCAEDALPYALALECIHTYSLIHDDLPCMDDDDLRRGRPTSHKVYGEAQALLAGDALLNYAFELMLSADRPADPARRIAAAREIAEAAGMFGMIGGQMADITDKTDTPERLAAMCRKKTGALIRGAVRAGARCAGAGESALSSLTAYGEGLGLSFQMVDDVLDVIGDSAALGKNVGSDAKEQKNTYATLLGVDRCRERAKEVTEAAVAALSSLAGSEFLAELAREMLTRLY
ncbi:MAG: polyprenyl synthetase family protein [Clostridia bacterium]|nr:polyprenyl synthetase family protein [Clostridia bacterium]